MAGRYPQIDWEWEPPVWQSNFEKSKMPIVALILTGYFLGSIPFAYLISRNKGVNILKEFGHSYILEVLEFQKNF